MQITSLSLRNFRVFESLDLDLPPGLVGVYGPNGAGKSSLLEAILWALYGRARTGKADIRTSGSSGECSVELAFVHEDHQYLVRRSISGVNATVKARVEIGGQTVADGPTEVGRFLRSTLGMEEAAFRSSVFAEQKQLAAFSDATPETRRRLVLQLLGITPIEKARDAARGDARARRSDHERLLHLLPDLSGLEQRLLDTETASVEASKHLESARRDHETASDTLQSVEASVRDLEKVRSTHALITQQGKAVRAERDRAAAALLQLEAERETLRHAETELAGLGQAREFPAREHDAQRFALLDRLEEAIAAGDLLPAVEVNDDGVSVADQLERLGVEVADFRDRESRYVADLAAAKAVLRAASGEADRAAAAVDRSSTLTAEADCPLCGQALGSGFSVVQQHRNDESERARRAVDEANQQVEKAMAAAARAASSVRELNARHTELKNRLTHLASAEARRRAADERVAVCLANVLSNGGGPTVGERAAIGARVENDRTDDQRRAVLTSQLDRLPKLQHAIESESGSLKTADALRLRLRSELDELQFDAGMFTMLDQQRSEAKIAVDNATRALQVAATGAAKAEQESSSATALWEQAKVQHQQAAALADEARHVGRAADLLHGFRQQVVSAIGPRLEIQASELFNELTAGEYDGIRLDPETYEISIVDAGVPYVSTRFSGSEVDLANLALRVAISEQVRFQAGGQVGLLVLDEALASLDVDRKDRMLAALTQLSGRFRQILVVTHAPEVKERLPQAIEVVKLPGRRGTARVVDAGGAY